MTTTAAKKIHPRASKVWERFRQWYGTKFIEQFGPTPPSDWSAAIEGTHPDSIQRALDICRAKYPDWPPTLPQFEAALKPPATAKQEQGPTIMDQLEAFARKQYRLTMMQEKKRSWISSGKTWAADTRIIGVKFPADGDAPEYRVMVADMGLSEATA